MSETWGQVIKLQTQNSNIINSTQTVAYLPFHHTQSNISIELEFLFMTTFISPFGFWPHFHQPVVDFVWLLFELQSTCKCWEASLLKTSASCGQNRHS